MRTGPIAMLVLVAVSRMVQPAMSQEAAPAQQRGADSDTVLAEVLVTAQKRTERITDVPISITAATAEQLNEQGVTEASDLGRIVPGFSYQKSNWGVPIFSIRGVGLYSTYAGISPTVSVYIDQVPLPYLVMTAGVGLDLERLEVLKGPQGTLFGQNSTGGAINYIAAKPTRDFYSGVDITYGRFNEFDTSTFVSGPLSDTVTARFAARHEGRDAWQESQTRPSDKLGVRDFTQARLLVDWEPTDSFRLEANLNGFVDKSDSEAQQFIGFCASGGVNCVGGYPDTLSLASRPPSPNNARLADWDPGVSFAQNTGLVQSALTANYKLTDKLTLTSITAYTVFHTHAPNDVDGTDLDTFRLTVDAAIRTFAQELRLAGDVTDHINMTLGANYERDIIHNNDVGHFTSSNSGVGPVRYSSFIDRADQDVGTKAVFGSVDWKLADSVTAQTGVRYTQQDRNFNGCLLDGGNGQLASAFTYLRSIITGQTIVTPPGACVSFESNTTFAPVPAEITSSLNQSNVSWRAGLNWKPSYDTLVYANVTRGYKSGAYEALPAVFANQLTPVTQESVVAYELGVKAAVTPSFSVTAAAFYYDYSNKQLEAFINIPPFGNQPALRNIPKSKVKGAEAELTARPVTGLSLSLGATYVHSEVSDSFVGQDPFGVDLNFKGMAFPNTPSWQALGGVDYQLALGGGYQGFFGGNLTYRSSTFSYFVIDEDPDFLIHSYWLLDLHAGIVSPGERLRVQLWGRNVTNKFYTIQATHLPDTINRTPGMPATYGVTLSFRF